MASSIINLMYFAYENMFYYVDVADVDPIYRDDFIQYITDVIDGVNMPNPTKNTGLELDASNVVQEIEIGAVGDPIGSYTKDTGDGVFPFTHGFQLTNIPKEQVITGYDAETVYNYDIEVQGNRYQFSALGEELVTYDDVVALVEDNSPAMLTYYTTTDSSTPYINISSDVMAVDTPADSESGASALTTVSSLAIHTFSNEAYTVDESTTDNGIYANYNLILPEPNAAQILTMVPDNDDVVFVFSVGTQKNLGIKGSQAQTYQGLIDTINRFDGINALYQTSGTNKNTVYLYVPIPKTPTIESVTSATTETDPAVITSNALLKSALNSYGGSGKALQIEDLTGLTTNSSILHVLKNSIHGGYTMLSVLQNSKRSNGSYWTEIAPIRNDKKSNDDIVAGIPEQALVIDAIDSLDIATAEEKRNMSLDLSSIKRISGPLAGGLDSSKLEVATDAASKVESIVENNYLTPPTVPTLPDVSSIQNSIADDGFAPGAISSTGVVLDASKLTAAQKAKLVPVPISTLT